MNILLHTYSIYFSLGLALLLFGCGSVKKSGKSPDKVRTERQFLRAVEAQHFSYEWMSAKAKGKWSDRYGSQGFTIQIRLHKDSAIWASASKFGFEVGRILVRQDSMFFINRINNEYFAEPISYLEQLGYPVNFHDLQQLIMGRPLQSIREYALVERDTNRYRIESIRDNPGLEEVYVLNEPGPIIRLLQWTDKNDRSINAELSEYQDITDNKKFSYFRHIELMGLERDNPSLKLEFKEVQLDEPVSLPFRIPSSYSNME